MPSQQVEVAEAIAGIKRALKREREGTITFSRLFPLNSAGTNGAPPESAPSDQPVVAASNRGNKLQQGAKFVHEGSLTYLSGSEVYREKIDHAGFTRYILERNPRRYNEYGEELEDSETDEEADADAADQNAYSGIRLEELLRPLKHPSELPHHPTMAPAYLSSALPDMVSSTHEKLRQERANLWRAKYLNRQLTGDASWIPAGEVETPEDWELFEPRYQGGHRQPSRKRKWQRDEHQGENRHCEQPLERQIARNGVSKEAGKSKQGDIHAQANGNRGADRVEKDRTAVMDDQAVGCDATNDQEVVNTVKDGFTDTADVGYRDAMKDETADQAQKLETNGVDPMPTEQNGMGKESDDQARPPNQEKDAVLRPESTSKAGIGEPAADEGEHAARKDDDDSPPPPPRRITRALAANNHSNSHSNAPTPPLSPSSASTSTSTSSQLRIDPLYLVPQSANPSNSAMAFHGLLPEGANETRRLLTLYIQKQEESVRGYEAILSKLLTAQRLRTEVLEMCKIEEHVGELSDGEDWIDAERWALQPGELRKGRDEDEDVMDENTIGGRKGKRRARN